MKEPSELDSTLIRDFLTKLSLATITNGNIDLNHWVEPKLIMTRIDAVNRMFTHYESMQKDLSRLVQEKYHGGF